MKKNPLPVYPWMFVFNDEAIGSIRRYGDRARVRYKIGPHMDGSPREKGMFVHGEDLLQLRAYFRGYGMYAEADMALEARKDYRAMRDGFKPKGQRT